MRDLQDLLYVPAGADDDEGDEEEGDEEWTSDDEMDEAEQISKAKSMAAVIKSSKGIRLRICCCTHSCASSTRPKKAQESSHVTFHAFSRQRSERESSFKSGLRQQ